MSIPEELIWILVARRGVSGTVKLLEAACRDLADRMNDAQVARQWQEAAHILQGTASLIGRIELPLIEEEPPEEEG
jgi:hypothetical protein